MSYKLKSNSFKTTIHHSLFSEMRFHNKLWKFFHHTEIEDRLSAWANAAKGDMFRLPVEWEMKHDELCVYLPPLPKGYLPFSEINNTPIDDQTKVQLIILLCDALSILNDNDFNIGFLLPESIYFNPDNLSILIDIQPFPTAFPFVNTLTDEYSYQFLSRYSRNFTMARVSDYHAIGLIIQWLFKTIPVYLEPIYYRLLHAPNTYLFAEEIANDLRIASGIPTISHSIERDPSSSWLHPSDPPISRENHEVIRSFLRSDNLHVIGLICEDEAILNDVYSQDFNEVLEHNIFIRINCNDQSFATLREFIMETMRVVLFYSPESSRLHQTFMRKFEQFLQKHFEGNDIFFSLTDWLFHYFKEIIPKLPLQELYYAFEKCEHFDHDSQLIFQSFLKKYSEKLPGLHFFFSGKDIPSRLLENLQHVLDLCEKTPKIYEILLISQLGRANHLLVELADEMNKNKVDYSYCRIILEELIQNKQLIIDNDGWVKSPSFSLDWESLSPQKLLSKRLKELEKEDLELLKVLAFLPMPIQCRSMFIANNIDLGIMSKFLTKLSNLSLLFVCHDECVFVPREVVNQALLHLSQNELNVYSQKAFTFQRNHSPNTLPPLIELAQIANDERVEYYLLIRYYRSVRSVLTYEKKKDLLERIKLLHQKLNRLPSIWLDRILCRLYQWLNQVTSAMELAASLYHRTGKLADRIEWILIQMTRNELDIISVRKELFEFIVGDHALDDKVRAAYFINFSNFYIPLQREEAESMHSFYITEVFPNRHQITHRYFCELTIYTCINIFKFFSEKEEFALSLLDKLESILETSMHHDLKLRLYDAYSFQSNMKLVLKYTHLGIEGSRRRRFTLKEQVGHLNGMEISLYQGDLTSYHYHKEQVLVVDKIKRKDLSESFVLNQLLYACEWEKWELFEDLAQLISNQTLTTSSQSLWEVYKRYASYRKKENLPIPIKLQVEEEQSLFVDALYQAEKGNVEQACQLFKRSISKNNAGMIAGWSYREIITIQLEFKLNDTAYWLEQFESYLNKYSYDVLWPDFYRFSANLALINGDIKSTLLFLRRAVNGYQLIEKEKWQNLVSQKLDSAIQPEILCPMPDIQDKSIVQTLIGERLHWLQQTLDLQIIIHLSEQITEKLQLSETVQRLTQALFDYFPVSQLVITFNLSHHKEKKVYSNSGLVDNTELIYYQSLENKISKHEYSLYQQGNQSMCMDLYIKETNTTKLQHMNHFLSFIKPHIGNALLYREMMIDGLTGYYLKRYFIEKINDELELSLRYGLDLSLIMIDIDNFRKVNEHGHQEGDRVLQEITDIIQANLRKNDIPGRYGGEEFLLILPKTDGQAALQIASKIREKIEQEFAFGRPYQVTVSVGVSSVELCNVETVEDLISYADNAEIIAKTTGKNKVIAAWTL